MLSEIVGGGWGEGLSLSWKGEEKQTRQEMAAILFCHEDGSAPVPDRDADGGQSLLRARTTPCSAHKSSHLDLPQVQLRSFP